MRFVVIGAHVLATLGRPRYTDDLDVLIEPTKANVKRLALALHAFGYAELADAAVGHFTAPDRMATLGRPPVAIDLLTSTPGVTFRQAWLGRQTIVIGRARIPFLGLKEFVRTKKRAGRPKDLLDLELLREAGVIPQRKSSSR